MKLISWNVNGIRACVKKGFLHYFEDVAADMFCIQETKLQAGQIDLDLPGFYQYWNYAEKKGYSGTAIFTKIKPERVQYGIGIEEHDQEGRVITLQFEQFYLVNVYTPNSKRDLTRLGYRLCWENDFRDYLLQLEKEKPVILCGDLNVAHSEIDVKNDKSNQGNSGFTDQERGKMTLLLENDFIDTYRYFYPLKDDAFTWWSYMSKVRERNIGWRIDYFIVSSSLKELLKESQIHADILGSDHCPIMLELV